MNNTFTQLKSNFSVEFPTVGSNTDRDGIGVFNPDGLLSYEERRLIETVIEIGVSMVLAFTGIVGNVLSLTTYAKLGYKETMNISMTFICSWDLVRCLLGLFSKIYHPLTHMAPTLSAKWLVYGFLGLGYPANISVYVSSVLAGYVAVERCLCVSMPFTVKILLTRRVVFMTNLMISLVVTASFVPFYSCITVIWVFRPDINATIPVWAIMKSCDSVFVYFSSVSTGWLLVSLAVIFFCSVVICYHLQQSSKFKSSNAAGSSNDGMSKGLTGRDRQVVRMLVVVIAAYVITSIPRVLIYLSSAIFTEFNRGKKEEHLFQVMRNVGTTIEFINYNVNIFIFYCMSSQFKSAFRATFCRSRRPAA